MLGERGPGMPSVARLMTASRALIQSCRLRRYAMQRTADSSHAPKSCQGRASASRRGSKILTQRRHSCGSARLQVSTISPSAMGRRQAFRDVWPHSVGASYLQRSHHGYERRRGVRLLPSRSDGLVDSCVSPTWAALRAEYCTAVVEPTRCSFRAGMPSCLNPSTCTSVAGA